MTDYARAPATALLPGVRATKVRDVRQTGTERQRARGAR